MSIVKAVVAELPKEGRTANRVSKAAMVVQVINGIDMLLGLFGIVPAGTIPTVVNGVVTIIGGITSWWSSRTEVVNAAAIVPSHQLRSQLLSAGVASKN